MCLNIGKRRILATFGFNRPTLRDTQPKQLSVFYALFLKIALSAAELMSFGQIGAAIWHRWTIIFGVSYLCYADKPETIDNISIYTDTPGVLFSRMRFSLTLWIMFLNWYFLFAVVVVVFLFILFWTISKNPSVFFFLTEYSKFVDLLKKI